MPTSNVFQSAQNRMSKSVDVLRAGLAKIRTGRIHTGIIDSIKVDYYGSLVSMDQAASLTVMDAKTLGVQPFDSSMIKNLEKAIRNANLGLNPAIQGSLIRVPIPPMSNERRKIMIQHAKNDCEAAKVSVRHIRRDANDELKRLGKDNHLSKDDTRQQTDAIQKLTDDFIILIDQMCLHKEKELLNS